MEILPARIDELANAVRDTPGYETWQPDKTPGSLDALGEWFASQVGKRPRTEEELRELDEQVNGGRRFAIEISKEELTNKTYSLAMDIGMYLSQVFLQNHSSLRWTQVFGNKKFIEYGQPVLADFDNDQFNPVRIMVVLARGLADKTRDGRRLRELYDIWRKKVRSDA